MIKLLCRIGRGWSVVLITLISVILSVIITYSIAVFTNTGLNMVGLIESIVAPALIAPAVSWYLVGMLIKIHHLEEEQRILATFDHLTGLMSRRAYFESSNMLISQCARNQLELTVAIIDIDNFKSINDQYGHAGGDEVLKSLSRLLKNITRTSDLLGRLESSGVVGRLGGEEFALTLFGIGLENTSSAMERIRATIAQDAVEYNSHRINYTVSIGVAKLKENSDEDLDHIIKRADEALYLAKSGGKNRVETNNSSIVS